jgi:dolichyl-phosphate beta-glucosyltransferase
MEQRPSAPRHQGRKRPRSALPGRVGRHLTWIVIFSIPAVLLWWHVWTGHPSSTLTCACGDPAQEVWFMAWPAWAMAHGANVFFSGAVNVPHGANLLSNTAGTLVGIVLAPITWLWGPVTATNVALTLAPALSCWGCWVALRRLIGWTPAAAPAALLYGYSSSIVTSLAFGHVSITFLLVPPLLVVLLYEIVVTQAHSWVRQGIELAVLLVVQFLISPEILVMAGLLGLVGLVLAAVVGRRQLTARFPHAARALALGGAVSVLLLAYPAWYGVNGPQAVSGVLFSFTAFAGVPLSGFFAPGPYGSHNAYVRFGGYSGRIGPWPNYLGWGVGVWTALSLFLARRRVVVWVFFVLALVAGWLALGQYLLGAPHRWMRIWLPWRTLSKLPVLKELLGDQFAPFITLFLAFALALGLDYGVTELRRRAGWSRSRSRTVATAATAALAVLALVPIFITFDLPFHVVPTKIPLWMRVDAPKLAANRVLLTVPFAVSGSTAPMLWQAVDDMHFSLAGGGLKTPNAHGGPVGQGTPGSARHILSDLSVVGDKQPNGTKAQIDTVRSALVAWHVTDVVIDGASPDPVYSSGFLTEVLGTAPRYVDHAWVWAVPRHLAPAAFGASLYLCRLASSAPDHRADPLFMSGCVVLAHDGAVSGQRTAL